MIPDIHSIVELLIAGQCTAQQAISWINTHMENADLRDHFAANAMQQVMTPNPVTGQYPDRSDYAGVAVSAYDMADAMLEARKA